MKRPAILKRGHHKSSSNHNGQETVPLQDLLDLQEELSVLKSECDDATDELHLAKATAKHLQEQVVTQEAAANRLIPECRAHEAAEADAAERAAQAAQRGELAERRLEQAIEEAASQKAALLGELAQAQKAEQQQRVVGTAQRSQNDQLKAAQATLERKASEATAAAEAMAHQLREELLAARSDVDRERATGAKMRMEWSAEASAAELLQQQLEESREESHSSTSRWRRLEEVVRERDSELEERESSLAGLRAEVSRLATLTADAQQAARAPTPRTVDGLSIDDAGAQLAECNTIISDLRAELRVATEDLRSPIASGAGTTADAAAESDLVQEQRELVAELRAELTDAQNQREQLEERAEAAASALASAAGTDDVLREQGDLVVELRAELQAALERRVQLEARAEALAEDRSPASVGQVGAVIAGTAGLLQEQRELAAEMRIELSAALEQRTELAEQVEELRAGDASIGAIVPDADEERLRIQVELIDELRAECAAAIRESGDVAQKAEEVALERRRFAEEASAAEAALEGARGEVALERRRLAEEASAAEAALEGARGEVALERRRLAEEASSAEAALEGARGECGELRQRLEDSEAAATVRALPAPVAKVAEANQNVARELLGDSSSTSGSEADDTGPAGAVASSPAAAPAVAAADWPAERTAGLELASELLASERRCAELEDELRQALAEMEESLRTEHCLHDELRGARADEAESAERADELAVQLADERSRAFAAADAAQDAWAKHAELDERATAGSEAQEELDLERRYHVEAADLAQSELEECEQLRQHLEGLEEELARERTSHLRAADQAESAWEQHAMLKSEVLSEESALELCEESRDALEQELVVARFETAASEDSHAAAVEEVEARVHALAEEAQEASFVGELRSELEEARRRSDTSTDDDAPASTAAVAEAEVRLRACEARAHALERELAEAEDQQKELQEKLTTAEYGLHVATEMMEEDDDGQVENPTFSIQEAQRLHQECRVLESRLEQDQAARSASPKQFTLRDTAAFGARGQGSPEVWNAVQKLRAELIDDDCLGGGIGTSPIRRRSESTPSFALEGAALGSRGGLRAAGDEVFAGTAAPTFDPPPRRIQLEKDLDAVPNPFDQEADEDNPFADDFAEEPSLTKAAPLAESPASTFRRKESTAFFGDADSDLAEEVACLQRGLRAEEAACAQAREELAAASVNSAAAAAATAARSAGGGGGARGDDVARLESALAEETAKSRRLCEHVLRAEESRRRLLHELAEDAGAEADLAALAKVVGRAARAIAAVTKEAPTQLPEDVIMAAASASSRRLPGRPAVTAAVTGSAAFVDEGLGRPPTVGVAAAAPVPPAAAAAAAQASQSGSRLNRLPAPPMPVRRETQDIASSLM